MKDWITRVTPDTSGGSVSVTVGPPPEADVTDQTYELADVNSIQPHPENARKGNLEVIRHSIRSNGFFGACVVQRSTGNILVGNHRYLAAVAEGIEAVPVVWVDKTDIEARQLLLVDNRTSDLATYDDEILSGLLQAVAETDDLGATGFGDSDIEALIKAIDEDNKGQNREGNGAMLSVLDVSVAEPTYQPETGSVWKMGPHHLVVDDVMTGWATWKPLLVEGSIFVPYPGPFVAVVADAEPSLLLVQPDKYLAGHVLDKWASVRDEPVRFGS